MYDNRNIESKMQYPLISEYVDAIRSAEDNFDKLSDLRPVLDGNGNPVMSSGNFAVVFKMEDVKTNKLYAVKCFTREQEHRNDNYQKIARELEKVSSPYLVHFHFFEKDLFVDTMQNDEDEFPVLLMDWVEGQPLDIYLQEHLSDDYERQMLTYHFCQMGAWLLSQPFAHGDLKPDNILVKQDGALVLVDYDGMYVPSMRGQKAQELGSPDYRHPLRTENDFNEHIDDFAIATIALSLKAISINASIYRSNGSNDTLLFSMKDYQDITNSESIRSLYAFLYDKELFALYNLFLLAYSTHSITASALLMVKEPAQKIYKEGELVIIPEGTDVIEYGQYEENTIIKCVKIPTTVSRIEEFAFRGCISLETIEIPCGVIEIESYAFWGCTSLKSVIIQNGVKNIGEEVFKDCISLEHIILPASTEIGCGAFDSCTSLNSVKLPDEITTISTCMFSGCTSLEYIKIPDSVIEIEDRAFENCSSLKAINLPNNIESIGSGCFSGCTSLTSFVIPNNITKIDECMFENCISLESIIIPTTTMSIGYKAFCGCKFLKSISIPENMTEIGAFAFDGCISLCSIKIPNNVKVGTGVFNHCDKNLQIYSDFLTCKEGFVTTYNNILLSYLGNDTNIIIPNSVTKIWGDIFKDCKSIQSVIIPYGITKIETQMFRGCSSLQFISIPNTVTEIGESAFNGCVSLKVIELPDSLVKIGGGAFSDCTALQSVEIPGSVEEIGNSAFYGCTSLKTVVLPCSGNRVELGSSIFEKCSSLRSIIIPDNVEKIGFDAFRDCVSLQTIKIGNGIKEIPSWTFKGCSSLGALYIPNNVNKIGSMAFYDCFNLKFMRLPDNVTIEGSALTNCNKELQLDCSSLEIVNGLVLANNRTLVISCLDNIINVVIPDGVIKIESGAFWGCSKIESIYISMGCKEIGCGAFYGCTQLKKIFIPSSITEWNVGWDTGNSGTEPFNGCTSLKSIYISPYYKQKLMKFKNLHLFVDKIKELYNTQLFEYMD